MSAVVGWSDFGCEGEERGRVSGRGGDGVRGRGRDGCGAAVFLHLHHHRNDWCEALEDLDESDRQVHVRRVAWGAVEEG